MSVTRRPNGKWRAVIRDAAGVQHTRHFDVKLQAERWERAELAKLDRGEWVDPALGRAQVRYLMPTWLATKSGLKPRSRAGYEALWRTLVEPRWGDVPLSRVSYADVVAWVAALNGELSPSRVRQALLVIKQILDLAVLDGRLARNVADPVKPTLSPVS